ncbi:MAG: TipAS antibiotic-recognition domain-containing protein [Oscillospiraceae bacterium]|nr:TipAS antibiotic-recognition domain-containing protein [Oscillospiraceae bacterium]
MVCCPHPLPLKVKIFDLKISQSSVKVNTYPCDIHRQCLSIFYPNYSKEYHIGLGEMYVADERFIANYNRGYGDYLRKQNRGV